MIWLLAGVVLWLVCGVLAFGFTLAYFQARFPRYNHYGFALFVGIFGPAGLIVAIAKGDLKHGLKFW